MGSAQKRGVTPTPNKKEPSVNTTNIDTVRDCGQREGEEVVIVLPLWRNDTMTNKTRTVSARIPNEVADSMEKRLKREGISLREMIVDYANGTEASVNTKISEKSLPTAKWEEMKSMAGFFGISIEELLDGVYQGLMDGYLTYEGGNVLGMPEIDFSEFKEVCGSKDPQKVLNDITRKIRSGLL